MKERPNYKNEIYIYIYIYVLFVDLGRAHAMTFAFVFINLYYEVKGPNHILGLGSCPKS